MTYRVTLSETAVRQLRKLPAESRKRIVKCMRLLEEDPFRPRSKADILPIGDTEPRKYRLRVREYRALYTVAGSEVKVIEVFARGREYR